MYLEVPIIGYEDSYTINTKGEVKSKDRYITSKDGIRLFKRGKTLTVTPIKNIDYMGVNLWKNNKGKTYYLHRLLAQHFIPNPDNLPEVNHIDGNRQNNSLNNLEWVTRQGNVLHAINNSLTKFTKRNLSHETYNDILLKFLNGENLTKLAKEYNTGLSKLSIHIKNQAIKYDLLKEYREQQFLQKCERQLNTAKPKRIKVRMLDKHTGEVLREFDSIRHAGKYLNKTTTGTISNCLNGRQNTAYGYKWEYIE